ncbi:MAG TPA: MFS transporter [Candidatus Ruania gallistercoris]|uniref:MFS transporter n=1 Tax=Candidatus Ruania gallistercoris TaxID=2838746 RepID=A0A9D2ECU3_9MICO|nr:MFS transporter [Candidatus Ruania gallistercoris]
MSRLPLQVSCVAQLLVVVDISVVNVALPSIQAELSMSAAAAPWVSMAYALGFAGVLLVGARLADTIGTTRALSWGAAVFTVASVAGGLAPSGGVLIGARALQGLSAAVVAPATLTLLTHTYPEGRERVRAIAWWTAVSVAGGGIGNITSGLLTDLVSWRAVLLVNLPVGLWVTLAAARLGRQSRERTGRGRFDLTGAAVATAGFSTATYALALVGGPGTIRVAMLAGGIAAGLLLGLVLHQRRSPHPLLPRGLLRGTILLGNLATALTAMAFQAALWYFLTYRMQNDLGYTALEAGLAFLPLTASLIAVNTWVTPRLLRRWPPGYPVALGAALAAMGLFAQGIAPETPFLLAVLAPTVLVGIGGGLVNTPLATIVTTGVAAEHAGAASGLMNTSKQLGGAVGLAAGTAVGVATGSEAAPFALMGVLMLAVAVLGFDLAALRTPAAVREG